MTISAFLYAIVGTQKFPCLLEYIRGQIIDLDEKGGSLFIDYNGLFFLVPRARIHAKLRAVQNWEQLESPQIRRPGLSIERAEAILCPQEIAHTILGVG